MRRPYVLGIAVAVVASGPFCKPVGRPGRNHDLFSGRSLDVYGSRWRHESVRPGQRGNGGNGATTGGSGALVSATVTVTPGKRWPSLLVPTAVAMSARVVAARTPRCSIHHCTCGCRCWRRRFGRPGGAGGTPNGGNGAGGDSGGGRPDPPVAPLVVMVAPGAISAPRADHRPAVVVEAEAEVLDSATASPEEVLWLKVGPVVVVPASPGQLEMELAEAGQWIRRWRRRHGDDSSWWRR